MDELDIKQIEKDYIMSLWKLYDSQKKMWENKYKEELWSKK